MPAPSGVGLVALALVGALPVPGADPRHLGAAGSIAFERLSIPADVPAHLASALAQDSRGFLWIGTQGGLVRWDGAAFRVFASDPADPATLGGGYVRTLLAARDGALWVGTFGGGLSRYDPATDGFTRYRHDAAAPGSLVHDRVEGLAEDRDGAIWIATGGGLDRLDPASGAIEHFRHVPGDDSSLADDRVRGLLVDRTGRLWVGSRRGLQRRLADGLGGGGFERVASDPADPDSLAGDFVERLFEDRRGRIWVGTEERGAAVVDPATGALRRVRGLSHRWVYGFAAVAGESEDSDEIWIATFGGGVDVVAAATLEVVARLRHDAALPDTLGSDRVGSILADRSGVVWVGSWGQGIARHDPSTRAFRPLRSSPSRPDGPSHAAVVRALPLDDGTVWAGTNGNGVDVLDGSGRLVAAHRPLAGAGALADGSVTCLARAAGGAVWVATLDGSLHRWLRGRFDRIAPRLLPGGPIRALTLAPDGFLWAGAAQGMARVDPASLEVRVVREWPGARSPPAIEAIAILPADSGALWVGSDNGLFRYESASGRSRRFARGLPDTWVPDLMVASDGRLWVGTNGGACRLVSWERDGEAEDSALACEPIAERIGRPTAPAQALVEDLEGQVWIGPRLRIDPRTWSARAFGAADGVAFHTFFIASRARDRMGRLYFGSPEGLLVVDPAALRTWNYAPPVVATALAVDGRPRPGAAALDLRSGLTLRPGERGFRLDFAALDFTAPERLRYRARLAGYDRDWVESDAARRSVAYSRLPPGSYRLRVEGTNRAGRWSETALELPLVVLPALHQTLWFRALVLAVVAGLAWGAHRLRVRQLRERGERLEREVAARTAELAAANQDLRVANRRIEEASLTDPLTGLGNRRYLEQTIQDDVEFTWRAYHGGDSPPESDLVVLILDLDHFKSVNDTHGHAAGDAVLVELAARLRSTFRSTDRLVRWGGEEFLVVARAIDRAAGPDLAEKLRGAVERRPFTLPDGTTLTRTASIGFAPFPFSRREPRAVSWETVVDMADLALFAAKRSGRNGWVGVVPPVDAAPEAARRWLADPATSVARGDLAIVASVPAWTETNSSTRPA